MFTTEQLAMLKPSGVFSPSGLNDDLRFRFEGQPFMAVDSFNAEEIDDAVRVVPNAQTRGYLLEVGIADGSQLSQAPDLLDQAIEQGFNNYHPNPSRRREVLSPTAVAQLELRGEGWKRATVVRQAYDADCLPAYEAELVPAWIRVINLTQGQFAREVSGLAGIGVAKARIAELIENLPDQPQHQKPSTSQFEHRFDALTYGSKVITTCMILANQAVAEWSKQNNIPILFRNYDPQSETAASENPVTQKATLSPQAGRHTSITAGADVAYTFFTSPMRRAADLLTHCQIGHSIAGQELKYTISDLSQIAKRLNQ
jgi:hypothetical protein